MHQEEMLDKTLDLWIVQEVAQLKQRQDVSLQEETKDQVVMKEMNKQVVLAFLTLISIAFTSCSEERLYENFHSFSNASWSANDSIAFDLSDLSGPYGKGLLALRYTEPYPYSNCYLKVVFKNAEKKILVDTLWNIPIFDSKSGQPLGKGFGSTYTVYDTLSFEVPQETREVLVSQYMRNSSLEGIEAVGFKLLVKN
jgi:gliding motility-associated lipoprotein GldH